MVANSHRYSGSFAFGEGEAAEQGELRQRIRALNSNVILIYIDDLRYMLDSDPYSDEAMPNLKIIAREKGILFENAQCPKPLCTPSRVSFLTGRRVSETGFKSYTANFNGNFKTFPGVLRNQYGYESYAFGKIFDSQSFGSNSGYYNEIDLCPPSANAKRRKTCSFTESFGQDKICCSVALPFENLTHIEDGAEPSYINFPHYSDCQYKMKGGLEKHTYTYRETEIYSSLKKETGIEAGDKPLIPYQKCRAMPNRVRRFNERNYLMYRGGSPIDLTDYGVATASLRRIKHFAEKKDPFIVAMGFYRPHLPLSSPEETWAHFDSFDFSDENNTGYWRNTFTQILPKELNPGANEASRYYSSAVGKEDGNTETGVRDILVKGNGKKESKWPIIRQAYYACARFIDMQLKRVIDELENFNSETRNNTHIIITSDHGFLLGEYNRLGKWVATEAGTRVPLVIIPSKNLLNLIPTIRVGTRVASPVDHIDVFPTVLDMTGIDYRNSDFIATDHLKKKPSNTNLLSGVSLTPYFTNPNTFTRSISVSEHEGQFSLRSKYFKFIAFPNTGKVYSNNSKGYLFDYRGGEYYRMVERENVFGDEKYANVTQYFLELWNNINRLNDRDAFKSIMYEKPFDMDYPQTRGANFEVDAIDSNQGSPSPSARPVLFPSTYSPSFHSSGAPTFEPSMSPTFLSPTSNIDNDSTNVPSGDGNSNLCDAICFAGVITASLAVASILFLPALVFVVKRYAALRNRSPAESLELKEEIKEPKPERLDSNASPEQQVNVVDLEAT